MALQSLSKNQLIYLVRKIIIDKFSTHLPNTSGGYMFRIMTESLGTIPIPDFEKEQKEAARRRQVRVDERIAALKAMKLQLLKSEQKDTAINEKAKRLRA